MQTQAAPAALADVTTEQLLAFYRTMLLIRRTEEQLARSYQQGNIPGACHTYVGQEAVAVGVCAHLRPDDVVFSTHRGHGHALAKGVPPREIVAELFGSETPTEPTVSPREIVPIGLVRRIIGARMAESARTVAPVTLTTEADASELARIRSHLKAELAGSDDPTPSFTDLLVRLVALALVEHPALNASLHDNRIVRYAAVNVGIAVDTERGLLVPVVRHAHQKSVQQIAAESARLIAQARGGTVAPDDLQGGTFTVTNLGMHDIDAFTPIVNLPECAILGLGRVVARPVVIDEETEAVAVRRMTALSLTFDHRVVDGAPAARFLQRVKQMVERPYAWLTR